MHPDRDPRARKGEETPFLCCLLCTSTSRRRRGRTVEVCLALRDQCARNTSVRSDPFNPSDRSFVQLVEFCLLLLRVLLASFIHSFTGGGLWVKPGHYPLNGPIARGRLTSDEPKPPTGQYPRPEPRNMRRWSCLLVDCHTTLLRRMIYSNIKSRSHSLPFFTVDQVSSECRLFGSWLLELTFFFFSSSFGFHCSLRIGNMANHWLTIDHFSRQRNHFDSTCLFNVHHLVKFILLLRVAHSLTCKLTFKPSLQWTDLSAWKKAFILLRRRRRPSLATLFNNVLSQKQ